ncbi:hypothetical protein Agub_g6740 [Astrephomene gubernaculifera]|uniref:Uncharacterized protein n=1 Tax=Astrephomene gubernaculifera TaxID=47775 RepID=A0AAD3HM36_9CHLO|nr:hypothetical protein Agub_g6740 [Astrephomene gubernaculifera]
MKTTGNNAANRRKTSGDRLSREALALLNSSNLLDRPSGSADVKPEPDLPIRVPTKGKKGLSAPPAPEIHPDSSQPLQNEQRGEDLFVQPGAREKKGTSSKRPEPHGSQPDTDAAWDVSKAKKHKSSRNSEVENQKPGGGDNAGAGPSSGDKDGAHAPRVSGPNGDGDPSKKRQRHSKSKDRSRHEGQEKEPATRSLNGADGGAPNSVAAADADRHAAGGSGAANKRNSKPHAAPAQGSEATAAAKEPLKEASAPAAAVPARAQHATGRAGDPPGAAQGAKPASRATDQGQHAPVVPEAAAGTSAAGAAAPQQAAAPINAGRPSAQPLPQHPAVYRGRDGGVSGAAVSANPAAAPAEVRRPAAPSARAPAEAAPGPAAVGGRPVANNASGAGASGSSGVAAQSDSEAASARVAAAVAAAAAKPLPPTGTTPIKVFAPVALPRLDDIGKHERSEVFELQRQLSELREMYDELKVTKIQELERVLAEQVEYTEEMVRHADQRARRWQQAAERAQQEAKEARSEETAQRIAALEAQVVELLKENSELLLRVVQREGELAQSQQAYHDLRAEMLQLQAARASGHKEGGDGGEGDGEGKGLADDKQPEDKGNAGEAAAGDRAPEGDGMEQDQARPSPVISLRRSFASPTVTLGTMLPAADSHIGRAVALQFPTPSPGVAVQYPTPGINSNLMRLQDMLGNLISMPGSGSRSRGPGVSIECQRIVDMLPNWAGIRTQSPSIRSCLASGLTPQVEQGEVTQAGASDAQGVTPSAAAAQQQEQAGTLLPSSNGRRSSGSPIDGICGADQRKTGVPNLTADISFAHGMGAPEAFALQGQYTFVDLNPASARKTERPPSMAAGFAAALGGAIAAADGDRPQQVAQLTAGSGVAHEAGSPGANVTGPLRFSPLGRAKAPVPMFATGGVTCGLPHSTGAGMAVMNSGSVASNQDSCTVNGLVARAKLHLEGLQRSASALAGLSPNKQPANDTAQVDAAVAGGSRSPVVENRRQSRLYVPSPLGRATSGRQTEQQVEPVPEMEEPPKEAEPSRPPPQRTPITGPTPRTAKLAVYEKLTDWHIEDATTKPERCIMTHIPSGVSFELREASLEDMELEAELSLERPEGQANGAGGSTAALANQPRLMVYTPLSLGSVEEHLPEYYKETLQFPENQRKAFTDRLRKAVADALAAKKQ